jgi:integrase
MIEESIQLHSSPYSIFILDIRSPITREKYLQRLGYFLDYVGIGEHDAIEERCNIFDEKAKNDINWVANNILKYLQVHKDRVERKEITGSTLRNYIKPIKLFCEQMDITIPRNKITRGMPKGRKYANDRAPTIEEIRRMLDYPDRRIKPIIYTMASSGIRLGAWDYLRWRNISPIIKDGKIIAAKITVYADEE